MDTRFQILSPSQAIPHVNALRALFLAEWARIDPFQDEAGSLPYPLVMWRSGEERLAGGLAFTRAPSPVDTSSSVWVNAVLVRPEYRRRGLATRLLLEAEGVSRERGLNALFAYTARPALYTRLGWDRVRRDADGHGVMARWLSSLVG